MKTLLSLITEAEKSNRMKIKIRFLMNKINKIKSKMSTEIDTITKILIQNTQKQKMLIY